MKTAKALMLAGLDEFLAGLDEDIARTSSNALIEDRDLLFTKRHQILELFDRSIERYAATLSDSDDQTDS
jgi:hypothetical protein